MSTEQASDIAPRGYWPKGIAATIISGLAGILAIFVAIKAAAHAPSEAPLFAYQDHLLRILAFAALTIWATFTIGLRRRGHAAIGALAFACVVELVIAPARGEAMGTLVSANLGIVFAYCAMHLYWLGLVKPKSRPDTAITA